VIPVIVPEIVLHGVTDGDAIAINGECRSRIEYDGGKRKSKFYVFAKEIFQLEDNLCSANNVSLRGRICNKPVYRETPLGKRITDITIETFRSCGKPDYIHCITWERNAICAARATAGDMVAVNGRIQSREYHKKLSESECETMITYEVSIFAIKIEGNKNEQNEN